MSSGADGGASLTPRLSFSLRLGRPHLAASLGRWQWEGLAASRQAAARPALAPAPGSPGRAQQSSVCVQPGSRAGPDFAAVLHEGLRAAGAQAELRVQAARLGRHQGAARGGGQAAAKSLPALGQAGTQAPQKMPRAAQINEPGDGKLLLGMADAPARDWAGAESLHLKVAFWDACLLAQHPIISLYFLVRDAFL